MMSMISLTVLARFTVLKFLENLPYWIWGRAKMSSTLNFSSLQLDLDTFRLLWNAWDRLAGQASSTARPSR